MSSRSNIKNLMRRLNVLSDIPEERMSVENRPASRILQLEKSDKHGSVRTTISESTDAMDIKSGLTGSPGKPNFALHSPQAGDLLFVPQDVESPTSFGPNNEYTAVPSVIEYSTTRGRSRVSIREATPEEARESAGSTMPIISEIPSFSQPGKVESGLQSNAVSLTSPPSNLKPVDGHRFIPRPAKRSSSASDQSMRTSTTSIRTSTVSASDQSIRTSTATENGDAVFGTGSDTATLNAPGSPPQHAATAASKHPEMTYSEKPISSAGSWPIHSASSIGSIRSHARNASVAPSGATAYSVPESHDTSQSRFSWHISKTDRTKNWFTRWFIEWWALEILSWFFSAICMMVIIIVLWKVDGKTIPSWKLGVSTNAFISIFSGFAKSALLLPTAEALGQLKWTWFRKERKMMDFEVLDSASRGAWGSMILLGKTKGITLASVGAAIILLSLPLDLFFQQIVSYPTVAIIDPTANATISRTTIYDPNEELQYQGDEAVVPWDGAMNSLVYPYWLGAGIPWDIAPDCPTGNCTFDPFYTLGVDFQCTEMPPNYLEFGCKNTSAEFLSTVQYQGPGRNPNVTSCGYYLNVPNDLPQLMSGYEVTADGAVGEVLATRFFSLSDIYTHEPFFGGSINFGNVQHPIVDFILATTPGGFDGATKNTTPVVTECEVHWVVKKLQAKVISGDLFEEAIETLQFSSDLDNPWNPENPQQYRANFTMNLPDPYSPTGRSTFGMDNVTAMKVWEVWAQIAPSTYTQPTKNNPITSDPVLKLFWLFNPQHLIKVYTPNLPWDAPANVTGHMSQAVTVMNQIVRRNANSQTHQHDDVPGTAIKYIVLVHIRWQWITLPVALLIFALIFLLTTILRSSRHKDQIGIWKTSALAILFNGLGDDVQNYVGEGNNRLGYARQKANDLKVQLEGD